MSFCNALHETAQNLNPVPNRHNSALHLLAILLAMSFCNALDETARDADVYRMYPLCVVMCVIRVVICVVMCVIRVVICVVMCVIRVVIFEICVVIFG